MLVLVLFVAVSSAGELSALLAAGGTAAVLLGVRLLAKGTAVAAFARPSGLSWRQAACLTAGTLPLSATAWLMGMDLGLTHPLLDGTLMPLVLASIALLELAAPLVLLYALRLAHETDPNA
jgi:hypothetical protein